MAGVGNDIFPPQAQVNNVYNSSLFLEGKKIEIVKKNIKTANIFREKGFNIV